MPFILHLYIRESLSHCHCCTARIFEHSLVSLHILLVLLVLASHTTLFCLDFTGL